MRTAMNASRVPGNDAGAAMTQESEVDSADALSSAGSLSSADADADALSSAGAAGAAGTAPAPARRVGPRQGVERRLRTIWADLLGHRDFGVQDNFFRVGGTSLLAVRLIARIRAELGYPISLTALLRAPTIAATAVLMRGGLAGSGRALVPLHAGGDRPPVFCLHPIGGSVVRYLPLAQALGPDQPVYGLQALGLSGATAQGSLAEMATAYLEEIVACRPDGPYQLVGYSFGGLVGLEVARLVLARTGQAPLLVLIDTPSDLAREVADRTDLSCGLDHLAGTVGVDPGQVRGLDRAAGLRRLHRLGVAAGTFADQFPVESMAGILDTVTASAGALRGYRPQPYPGEIVLIHGGDPAAEEDHGWGRYAAGVTTYRLPLGHQLLMEERGARRIAALLTRHLQPAGVRLASPR